jgi:hypothetical protein
MRIEAFTEAKIPADPGSNEDQLLILPGRGHAVIDGVTDRTGHRYDGLLAGQLAGRTVQEAWEASFREVERVDPEKIGRYAGVKGSEPGRHADDRTVIVIHLP